MSGGSYTTPPRDVLVRSPGIERFQDVRTMPARVLPHPNSPVVRDLYRDFALQPESNGGNGHTEDQNAQTANAVEPAYNSGLPTPPHLVRRL